MSKPVMNSVAWFEIGTDRPADVKQFFGDLFGWTFEAEATPDGPYDNATAPGAEAPGGGVFGSGGNFPDYAIFYVIVPDVAEAVTRAEKLGATVVLPPKTAQTGLVFAQLLDPAGHHFGVFTPPPVA